MEDLASRLQEGILKEFRDNPYPGDTIAIDIASYIESDQVNDNLVTLSEALRSLNQNGTAYYTVTSIEIVMEI